MEDTTQPLPPLVNRAIDAPTVYADLLMLCTAVNGVVRMSFVESVADPSDGPDPGWKNAYVGTLMMPAPGFLGMVEYLNKQAQFFLEQGLISAPE